MDSTEKKRTPGPAGKIQQICFGLDRLTDEQSLALFIERFAAPRLLNALIPRLTDNEITATINLITQLMKKHLNEKEYHRLFLSER